MKKFLLLLVVVLLVPFMVFADEGEEDLLIATSNEVKVYFFRGEGCPHCADAETFFQSIEEEYGSMFEIVDYETWYNTENAALLEKVGEVRGEEIGGVPYILIGNKSWNGFTDEWGQEMLAEIKSQYNVDPAERYDVMQLIDTGSTGGEEKKSVGSDILSLVVILLIACGIGFGISKARSTVTE